MAADGESFLVRALPRNMCAGVRVVPKWASISRSVPISLSELAIIYLAVYKLEEGCALPRVGRETAVYGSSHRLCGRANLYI